MKTIRAVSLGDLLAFIEALTEPKDPILFVPVTPEERAASQKKRLASMRRSIAQMPERAREVRDDMNGPPCCEDNVHRTKPENPRDWHAIDNFVTKLVHRYLEDSEKMVHLLEGLMRQSLEQQGMDVSEETNECLAHVGRSMGVSRSLLEAHLNLVGLKERGQFADMHYDRIVGLIEQNTPGSLARLDRRINGQKEEQDESGPAD